MIERRRLGYSLYFCDCSWKYFHCSVLGMSFRLPMIGSPGGPGGRCLLREPMIDERIDDMASDVMWKGGRLEMSRCRGSSESLETQTRHARLMYPHAGGPVT